MDKRIVEEKLEALRRCIHRVEEKRPATAEVLRKNFDLQDIISVNLQRAVQLCVDIGSHMIAEADYSAPTTMGETFEVLFRMNVIDSETSERMKKAVGFRNIAVHN